MKVERRGGARANAGRKAGEPKKAIGVRVHTRFHKLLTEFVKEKEQEYLTAERNKQAI